MKKIMLMLTLVVFAVAGSAAELKELNSFLGIQFAQRMPDPQNRYALAVRFTPAIPYKDFTDYFVTITPNTQRVAAISMARTYATQEEAGTCMYNTVMYLRKTYDVPYTMEDGGVFAFKFNRGRVITISMVSSGQNTCVLVTAGDDLLIRQAEKEKQALKSQGNEALAR